VEVRNSYFTSGLDANSYNRNLGILWAMVVAFCAFYLLCTEYISAEKSKGEVLLFQRGKTPKIKAAKQDIEEASPNRVDADMIAIQKTQTHVPVNIQKQTAIFHWDGMNYDIKVSRKPIISLLNCLVPPKAIFCSLPSLPTRSKCTFLIFSPDQEGTTSITG
jgi:hypothetical protein